MTGSRLVISLLRDPATSDRLLERVHQLLPRAHAATTALLRPPTPDLAAAPAAIPRGAVVVADSIDNLELADAATDVHWFVWCRDDDDAERCGPPLTPLLADDVEALAWELVRRLAGDGGDTPIRSPEPSAAPLPVGGDAREPIAAEPRVEPASIPATGAGLDPIISERAQRRIVPPAWAATPHLAVPSAPGSSPAVPPSRRPAIPTWASAPRAGDAGRETAVVSAPRPLTAPLRDLRAATVASEVAAAPDPLAADLPSPLSALAAGLPRQESDDATGSMAVSAQPTPAPPSAHRTPDDAGAPPQTGRGSSWMSGIRRAGEAMRPRRAANPAALAPLGQDLVRCHSTVILVGTSKGGPGKTTQAAAIAMLGGHAVEPHGGSAVFVDANLNNPDAWKRLGVPAHAATVRDVVDALNRGAVPPDGELARDARLRVLPEVRGGMTSYSAAEIDRLVRHLRLRHTLVVVDLPNVLPSLVHGPTEAAVAHWLRHADVFVLPIDIGGSSFVAAGEVLDSLDELVGTIGGPAHMPGVIVPLLVPRGGERTVRSPQVAELLDHLREAGAEVVEVPQTIEVQAAEHFKRPVIGVSPRADSAFIRVLHAVVDAAVTAHGETRRDARDA